MISISPIAIFTDNYVWLIEHENGKACVVDPGDVSPVQQALQAKGLTLTSILITHHHSDHTGGIDSLVNTYKQVTVYGPKSKKIPQITHILKHDDEINVFNDASLTLKTIEVPGHTNEHIAYFGDISSNHQQANTNTQDSLQQPVLFSGDTLFAGGCGRLLGGTAKQLCNSLKALSSLPANTQVYCTHEYTLANLAFAAVVEPSNALIKARINTEALKRDQETPTLPTSIKLEQQTNPFLRCTQTDVIKAINQHWGKNWQTEQELFTGLRRWKDNF
jgi:hydroxyacylglutathione hydrolase